MDTTVDKPTITPEDLLLSLREAADLIEKHPEVWTRGAYLDQRVRAEDRPVDLLHGAATWDSHASVPRLIEWQKTSEDEAPACGLCAVGAVIYVAVFNDRIPGLLEQAQNDSLWGIAETAIDKTWEEVLGEQKYGISVTSQIITMNDDRDTDSLRASAYLRKRADLLEGALGE